MKNLRRLFVLLSLCTTASLAAHAQLGKWVSPTKLPKDATPYKHVSIQVKKIETVKSFAGLGKLVRFGAEEKQQTANVQKAIDSKKFKVIVVTLSLRNDTDKPLNLGYWANLNSGSESVSDAFRFWLRGEEGTEVCGDDNLNFGDEWKNSALHLTSFLSGGMPKAGAVPPKGVVTGKIAYVVKDWYVPSKIFLRMYSEGLPVVAVSLK